MKEYVTDTSKVYEHLVGFVAEENRAVSLGGFLGDEEEEYTPKVEAKSINPDFPEDWQMLYVSFSGLDDYAAFMRLIGQVPLVKLNELVFTPPGGVRGLDAFFGE